MNIGSKGVMRLRLQWKRKKELQDTLNHSQAEDCYLPSNEVESIDHSNSDNASAYEFGRW